MQDKPAVLNHLASLRANAGLSAVELARAVGVSRQTVYAIEAGSYVPNTEVALKLARVLNTSVEGLFRLSPDPAAAPAPAEDVIRVPDDEVNVGDPVNVCPVDGRLMALAARPVSWCFPASDGVLTASTARRAQARLARPVSQLPERLLLAGCDPALALIGRYLERAGVELLLLHRNSAQALSLLKQNCVHIAGTHLRAPALDASVKVVSFATWQEGLVVATGNPREIEGVASLTRRGIRFVNREPGAASRRVLDAEVKRLKIDPRRIQGYADTASGHLAAAARVKTGTADCCIATEPAARFHGLHFIPLGSARFDLVVGARSFEQPAVQKFFDAITRLDLRRQLAAIAGYETSVTGNRVH